jgi:hypothetical protein
LPTSESTENREERAARRKYMREYMRVYCDNDEFRHKRKLYMRAYRAAAELKEMQKRDARHV